MSSTTWNASPTHLAYRSRRSRSGWGSDFPQCAPSRTDARMRAPVLRMCMNSSSGNVIVLPTASRSIAWPPAMPREPPAAAKSWIIFSCTAASSDSLYSLMSWKAKLCSASPARSAVASSNSTWQVGFDEATALLAGDALQSFAFQLMSEYKLSDDAAVQLKMIQLFAAAGGSRGMAGGQAIDLDAVGKTITLPELEFMHILKTGALIRASVLLGAHCGKTLPQADLDRLD